MLQRIKEKIFSITNESEFNDCALEIFSYQLKNNPIYNEYVSLIRKDRHISTYKHIPFLPVVFFKTKKVITGNENVQESFSSSGTTGMVKSFHYVTDLSIYELSSVMSFEKLYGNISNYTILALLPSYMERKDSSLVWMVNHFISKSNFKADGGFYMNNHAKLLDKLKIISKDKTRKILLLGISYALLDLAEKIDFSLDNVIVMETGGMKGMMKEMIREELHEILCSKMGISVVHSEYGMTELLSQAYSKGKGIYSCPPWMKVLTRELNDPFTLAGEGRSGGINIIDLANINSCSFIATQDVGKCNTDGTFEITGRFDNSDVRGCNLLQP